MANKQALALLQKGDVDGFNSWVKQRRKNGKKAIDLDDQNLSGLKLRNVDLRDAHLNGDLAQHFLRVCVMPGCAKPTCARPISSLQTWQMPISSRPRARALCSIRPT